MVFISLVLPVRNRKDYTQGILSQIYTQFSQIAEAQNFSVIVVDDGSTDGTQEIIRSKFPDVHLIQADGSLWWTGAICEGMKYASEKLKADYVVWLNDDISIADDLISNIYKICSHPDSKTAIIGGIIRSKKYPNWIVYSGISKYHRVRDLNYFAEQEEVEVDTLNGNIVIVSRTIFEQIGLPDASQFKHYGGDYDFSMRTKEAGFKVKLSSLLQGYNDYQISDLIRCMPVKMQWHLERNWFKKYKLIRGLTNLKSNYNIEHKVNIVYRNRDRESWAYLKFYLRHLRDILLSNFEDRNKIEKEIKSYLRRENVPEEMADAIIGYLKKK
ncbi:glycosyltransferase family 2 protein [Cronbergia sp. UHCC 0137]|uniref:glycosyltransferase family 2 protein n=1 Tax=Cronbergia sp. UHCC 0137 TaxID=3110239 RepID=UPI002B2062DC|nr:glycosyltransferase family 2 protein [Cronbergia sp. UHCC 0137]MEA5619593.1 glycosyltransferase family 2 protein [Cronbergia sp. UHCC 0137]